MVNSLLSSLLASTHWTHMMNQPTLLATLEMMLSPTTRLSWELTNKMDSISGAVASTIHTQCTHRRPKRSVAYQNDLLVVRYVLIFPYCTLMRLLEINYILPMRNCPIKTEGSSVRDKRLKFTNRLPAKFSTLRDPDM